METWTLDHPSLGLIKVSVGFDRDFAAADPTWPGEAETKDGSLATADSTLRERISLRRRNPQVRMQVTVAGEVQHRYNDLNTGRYPLFGPGPKDELETPVSLGVDRSKPHLMVQSNAFKELLSLEYREGSTVVEFDPPAGTRGARRRETMESSDLKRTLIPMAEGLGKGGWALAVLVLGPIVGRLLDKLLSYFPDIDLPEIQLPHLDLPVPQLPHVDLPVPSIEFPGIDLPQLPEWVVWLMDYSKIWVPVLLGIVVGIIALRNHRKSEQEKAAWEANSPVRDS